MPYPNEHSARVSSPGQYDRFARKNIAPGIDIILGIKEGKSEAQAYRFDKNKFTVAEAKKWLKDNDISYLSFEPATEENAEMFVLQGSQSNFENFVNSEIKPDGKLYKKEIIRVGEWVHPQNHKYKFRVTLDRMKEWITNFNKNLFSAFVPERHSENPSDNRGWIKGLQIEGEKLIGIFDITDKGAQEKIDNKTIKDVSIACDDYIDNKGNQHGNVIKHVCLTVIPHIDNQEGFMALENGDKINIIYLEKSKEEDIKMDELLKAKMELEKAVNEKTELEKVNAENVKKIAELEKANVEAIKAKDSKIVELEKAVAEFETMKAKAREEEIDLRLENLVKDKKILPAKRDELKPIVIQNATLKLEKGEVNITDIILQAYGESEDVIKFGAESKSKDEKPADGIMTPEKAKLEAERIEAESKKYKGEEKK